jgi:hypothetical protein
MILFRLDLVEGLCLTFSVDRANAKLPPPLLANLTALRTLSTSSVFPGLGRDGLIFFEGAGRPSILDIIASDEARSFSDFSVGANFTRCR